ncbi:MAG: SsrA-binding protein SmpB [Rickettsiales bacterium]|jgi:SsrA-binding protein|nr:SsrA-binding protein SmpB [Rickettsiales bacterium]
MSKPSSITIYATNKKANFNYNINDKFEAGIVLTGNEVKSIRTGKCNLSESFVIIRDGHPYIENFHISLYSNAREKEYQPTRRRKLLLKQREINKIMGFLQKSGTSATSLKIYNSSRNFLKVEIALVTGKKLYDKRESIKNREWERNKSRILKEQ